MSNTLLTVLCRLAYKEPPSKQPKSRSSSPAYFPLQTCQTTRNTTNPMPSNDTKSCAFTTVEQPSLLITTPKPVALNIVNSLLNTEKDIQYICSTAMPHAQVYRFDKVFTDSDSIHRIYTDYIKTIPQRAVIGEKGLIVLFGPTNGGKSLLFKGSHEEKGLFGLIVEECLNITALSKASNKDCNYEVLISMISVSSNASMEILGPSNKQVNYIFSEKGYWEPEGIRDKKVQCINELPSILQHAEKMRKMESILSGTEMAGTHLVANIKIKKYKKGKLEVEGLIQLVEVIGSDCAMGNNKIQRSLANCMNYLSEAIYHSAVGKLYKNIDKTPLTKAISPTLCSGNPNIVFINCVSTAQKDYGHMIPSIKYACSIRECALRDAHATSKDDSDNELDLKSQHKDTLSPPIHLDKTFDEDDLKVENQNQIKEPTIRLNKSNRFDAEEESIQSNRELERNDKIMSLENKISQIANGRGHTKTQSMQVKLSKTIIPALPNHNKLADNYYNDLLNTVHITENEVSQKNALIAKYEKALNSQKESYDNSINEIKQNNDTKLSALRDQVNSLQLSVHQLQSQKNELENQLNAKSSENEKLKQSSTYNEQQTNSLKLKLSTVISAQSEEYKTKDVAKQSDITALKKELSNKESELNQFKITIKEQSNEIKEWKSKLDQVTLLKVQCKDEVNKHKTKLEIVQNAFTELSQKARLEQSKYSELLQQKESVMTEIDSYKTKCEEYIKKYKSELESNSMLEGQISEMKNSNGELSQKFDDSVKELSLVKKDVSTLQETIKSLEVRLTNALAKNETLMREKSELESQNIKANSILLEYEAKISEAQAIQNKGNAYRQEEVDGLNKKISELEAEISENNKANEEFIIEVNNLRTEIGLANKKIESLDSNKCIAEANYIKANTEIKATNKSLCEKLSAVNDEKGRLLAEIERNKIAEAKSHKYIDSFKEENEELILTNKVLKKKIHDMEEELREFIGSHKDTHKAIASKENMLSDIQTMIKTFRSHHSKEGSKAKKTSFIN